MRGRPFFCLRCHYGQVPAPGAESEALGPHAAFTEGNVFGGRDVY